MQKGPQLDLGGDSVTTRYRRASAKEEARAVAVAEPVVCGVTMSSYAFGVRWGGPARIVEGLSATEGVAINRPAKSQEQMAGSNSQSPHRQPIRGKETAAEDIDKRFGSHRRRVHRLDLHYLPAGTQLLVHVRLKSYGLIPKAKRS